LAPAVCFLGLICVQEFSMSEETNVSSEAVVVESVPSKKTKSGLVTAVVILLGLVVLVALNMR
jgi:hypothetical protein